jgi:hypothetical protein
VLNNTREPDVLLSPDTALSAFQDLLNNRLAYLLEHLGIVQLETKFNMFANRLARFFRNDAPPNR